MAANNVQVCKKHDNCECKYYCKDCKKNICLVCTLKDDEHAQHNFCTTTQAITEIQDGVKQTSDIIDEMIKSFDEGSGKIEAMKTKIQEQAASIKDKIEKHYQELEQQLKEQKDIVKEQVSKAVKRKENTLKTQLATIRQAKSKVEDLKAMKNSLMEKSHQEALSGVVAQRKEEIDECLVKLKATNGSINLEPEEIDNIDLYPSKSLFPQFCNLSVGSISTSSKLLVPTEVYLNDKITISLLTKNSEGHCCSEGGNKVSMLLETSKGEISTLCVEDNRDGSYVASFVAKQVGQVKLSVSINGLQIRGNPYSISVVRNYRAINSQLQPTKIVNNDGSMKHPWGIAFGKYGVWAVADYSSHCVNIFNREDQLVRKFGQRGSSKGEFKFPKGVTFDDNNHLYVADSSCRVQKFDVDGSYLLRCGGRGSGDGQLDDPQGITAHNGRVYVADTSNHRISVFKYDGQFCISFKSDQLSSFFNIVVNVDNQLIVADYSNHCIFIFSLDGQLLGKKATQGTSKGQVYYPFGLATEYGQLLGKKATQGTSKGQLYYPFGLATDVNGFVLVGECDSSSNRLSVFDRHGTFINCFGSNGSAKGQFDHIRGIALSPNGSIYVSDSKNKRVQIFANY